MPSFRTIAYLKKNNAEAFRKVFRQFVLMLKDMGLIEGETIGIDSFKIFAQNSLRNNYTQKKIDRHLEYIDNRIEEFEVALDKTDKEEQRQDRLPDGERGYRVLGNEQMAEQRAVIGERGNDGIMLARVKAAQRAERRDRAGLWQDRRYALIQTLSDVLAENGGV